MAETAPEAARQHPFGKPSFGKAAVHPEKSEKDKAFKFPDASGVTEPKPPKC